MKIKYDNQVGSGTKRTQPNIHKQKVTTRKIMIIERLIELHWRKTFVKKHGNILKKIPDHLTVDQYIRDVTRIWFRSSAIKADSFEQRLYETGLRRNHCTKLMETFRPLLDSSYTYEQIFDFILDCALGKIKSVVKRQNQRFLYDDIESDSWSDREKRVVYNVASRTIKDIKGACDSLPHVSKDVRLFFHCTNWQSYLSIMKSGVRSRFGRPCLDFGMLPSFYTTPNLDTALEWGDKCRNAWRDEACILVFGVTNSHLKPQNDVDLSVKRFDTPNREWKELVAQSRRCNDDANELDDYDVVYGPMCANPERVKNGEGMATTHQAIKWQLASKSDKSDKMMSGCFKGMICLPRKAT